MAVALSAPDSFSTPGCGEASTLSMMMTVRTQQGHQPLPTLQTLFTRCTTVPDSDMSNKTKRWGACTTLQLCCWLVQRLEHRWLFGAGPCYRGCQVLREDESKMHVRSRGERTTSSPGSGASRYSRSRHTRGYPQLCSHPRQKPRSLRQWNGTHE